MNKSAELVPTLQHLQHEKGWISKEDMVATAKELGLPLYHVHGVVTFYPHFRLQPPPKHAIHICTDLNCHMKHGGKIVQQAEDLARGRPDIEVKPCSCLGQCDKAPAAMIDEWPYAPETPAALLSIIRDVVNDIPLPKTPTSGPSSPFKSDPYEKQDDFYQALRDLVTGDKEQQPDRNKAALAQVLDSGLRGMGGAAFPVGRKWEGVLNPRAQARPARYVVCNGDESEVGTMKDRELLRNMPHLVIEGMAVAGVIANAHRGYLYVRHEYVEQIAILEAEIARAYKIGALGKNIFGSGRTFDLSIFVSPGGYIQGEGSALMEAIEGRRGQPRNGTEDFGSAARSTNNGLFGMPTILNNVESFLYVPAILVKGAEWFKSLGVSGNSGLKWVGIGGDVARPQVMEVPHGMTFREALDICGGMAGGKKLKAIMPSGPSFGFLPPEFLDARMEFPRKGDYGMLAQAGASIGSAAVVFLNEERDLVDAALNCTQFYRNESCGKCVPCRVGSQKMVDIIEGVMDGTARGDDIDQVERLARTLYLTSICGLGQVVPKPFESVVKYWPQDPRIVHARQRGAGAPKHVAVTINGKDHDGSGSKVATVVAADTAADLAKGAQKAQDANDVKIAGTVGGKSDGPSGAKSGDVK
ncbi:MAG TPA: NAD(P)H-dependent oxidoreductase subunit E [Tepidisphaeraceae bacterium]|jgi:NADH:ubiquinone oxidoreductase subunit F (NADH-binding)/NADH:ubiquinone oxidoreductase subunit E